MAINPNYETIGKSFVQQYYALFDGDATQRAGLAAFYSVSINSSVPMTHPNDLPLSASYYLS